MPVGRTGCTHRELVRMGTGSGRGYKCITRKAKFYQYLDGRQTYTEDE